MATVGVDTERVVAHTHTHTHTLTPHFDAHRNMRAHTVKRKRARPAGGGVAPSTVPTGGRLGREMAALARLLPSAAMPATADGAPAFPPAAKKRALGPLAAPAPSPPSRTADANTAGSAPLAGALTPAQPMSTQRELCYSWLSSRQSFDDLVASAKKKTPDTLAAAAADDDSGDVDMDDVIPPPTCDLTPRGKAITPGVAQGILSLVIDRMVRRQVEATTPSLSEVVQHTTYATGQRMAAAEGFGLRSRVQALAQSDGDRIGSLWRSPALARNHPPEWFDTECVVDLPHLSTPQQLTRKDICTLAPRTWLNDKIINAYLQMLVLRASALPAEYPKTHALTTFWFTKLCQGAHSMDALRAYSYDKIKRWTRKVDVFEYELLLIPVNWGGNHWTLCAVDFRVNKIVYYDSSRGATAGDVVSRAVHRWLSDEHAARKGGPLPEMFLHAEGDVAVPQQHGPFDCGIFTCSFANCLTANRPLTFAQKDVQYLRQRMVIELIEGRVPIPI